MDKYPELFQLVLNMDVKSNQSPLAADEPWANQEEFQFQLPKSPQSCLFTSPNEMDKLVHVFGKLSLASK